MFILALNTANSTNLWLWCKTKLNLETSPQSTRFVVRLLYRLIGLIGLSFNKRLIVDFNLYTHIHINHFLSKCLGHMKATTDHTLSLLKMKLDDYRTFKVRPRWLLLPPALKLVLVRTLAPNCHSLIELCIISGLKNWILKVIWKDLKCGGQTLECRLFVT